MLAEVNSISKFWQIRTASCHIVDFVIPIRLGIRIDDKSAHFFPPLRQFISGFFENTRLLSKNLRAAHLIDPFIAPARAFIPRNVGKSALHRTPAGKVEALLGNSSRTPNVPLAESNTLSTMVTVAV